VYSRELEGEALTLAASGWTYFSTFVLYDKESESIWFSDVGHNGRLLRCVSGFHQDKVLEILPHLRMLWRSWKVSYPDTKIMVRK
jgi:hypothetical protein